jgi:hypothetical protein
VGLGLQSQRRWGANGVAGELREAMFDAEQHGRTKRTGGEVDARGSLAGLAGGAGSVFKGLS